MSVMKNNKRTLATMGAAICAVLALGLSGCSTENPATPDENSAVTDPAILQKAQQLVELGTNGLIYSDKPENETTLGDWKEWTGWTTPESTPAPPKDMKIYSIACVEVAPFCRDQALGAVHAAEELGWEGVFVDGEGSPEGYAKAFQTAIAGDADAIITNGMPESLVGPYIAEARSKGIMTIGISSIREEGVPEEQHYDAYVSGVENLNAQLQAWWVVADSDGEGNVAYIWDPSTKVHADSLDNAMFILEDQCAGCNVLEVVNADIPTMADPTRAQDLAQSLIQRNSGLEYVVVPYGLGTRPIIEAGISLGKDVQFVGRNSDPVNIGYVHEGILAAENGTYPELIGWTAIDQAIRLLAGEEPLEDWEYQLPIHIYVAENAPADGTFDWIGATDYVSHFRSLWGL